MVQALGERDSVLPRLEFKVARKFLLVCYDLGWRFPAGEDFKHFDLKWHDYDGIAWLPVADKELDARLQDMARKVFTGLKGRGFGRLDVRSDPAGARLQLLEAGPYSGPSPLLRLKLSVRSGI